MTSFEKRFEKPMKKLFKICDNGLKREGVLYPEDIVKILECAYAMQISLRDFDCKYNEALAVNCETEMKLKSRLYAKIREQHEEIIKLGGNPKDDDLELEADLFRG